MASIEELRDTRIKKIELLKNSYDNVDTQKYLQIVDKVGNNVVKRKEIVGW